MFISSAVSLSACDESGTVLDVEDTTVSNPDENPCLLGADSSLEPFDNLLKRYSYYLDLLLLLFLL